MKKLLLVVATISRVSHKCLQVANKSQVSREEFLCSHVQTVICPSI